MLCSRPETLHLNSKSHYLASVCVRSGIGHAQNPGACVSELKVLVLKACTCNTTCMAFLLHLLCSQMSALRLKLSFLKIQAAAMDQSHTHIKDATSLNTKPTVDGAPTSTISPGKVTTLQGHQAYILSGLSNSVF